MKSLFCSILMTCFLLLMLSSCKKIDYDLDSPVDNFNILWKTIDEKYCYFEYKSINWDSLYFAYLPRVSSVRNSSQLFFLFCDLLSHLKDGHVNLYTSLDVGRYWKWSSDYPKNFSQDVLDDYYLKEDYYISGGIKYKKINPKIGYMRYESFSSGIGHGNVAQVLYVFKNCKGLIIDVRQNGGGNLNYASVLASHFIDKPLTYGYIMHKTGKNHNDFSQALPLHVYPAKDEYWGKPVVVLTNRHCYSTTTNFAMIMKLIDQVSIIGDQTGGGAGLPFGSELPCGWQFRFSSSPTLNLDFEHVENGILPDIKIEMDTLALRNGKDSMIEYAIDYLLNN